MSASSACGAGIMRPTPRCRRSRGWLGLQFASGAMILTGSMSQKLNFTWTRAGRYAGCIRSFSGNVARKRCESRASYRQDDSRRFVETACRYFVFFQFAVERPAVNAEDFSRAEMIAARHFEDAQDVSALDFIERALFV